MNVVTGNCPGALRERAVGSPPEGEHRTAQGFSQALALGAAIPQARPERAAERGDFNPKGIVHRT